MANYGWGEGLAGGVELGNQIGNQAYTQQLMGRQDKRAEESHALGMEKTKLELAKLNTDGQMIHIDTALNAFSDPYTRKAMKQLVAPYEVDGKIRSDVARSIITKMNEDPTKLAELKLQNMATVKGQLTQRMQQLDPNKPEHYDEWKQVKDELGNIDQQEKIIKTTIPAFISAEAAKTRGEAAMKRAEQPKIEDPAKNYSNRAAMERDQIEKDKILGKEISPEKAAFAKAFDARKAGAEIDLPDTVKKGIDNIVNDVTSLRMSPEVAMSQFVQRMGGKNSGAIRLYIENGIKAKYPDFDFTKASTQYKASQNMAFIRSEKRVQSVIETAEAVKKLIPALKNGDLQTINEINNWWKTKTGNPAPTNWKTAAIAMAQEFNQGYTDSNINPEGRFNKEIKNLEADNSPKQLLESLNTNLALTKIRQKAVQGMRQPYTVDEITGPAANLDSPGTGKGGGTGGTQRSNSNLKSLEPEITKTFPGVAGRVAMHFLEKESGGVSKDSKPNKDGTVDHGVFQINDVNVKILKDAGIIKDVLDLKDNSTNIKAAKYLYSKFGWMPWVNAELKRQGIPIETLSKEKLKELQKKALDLLNQGIIPGGKSDV